MRDQYAGDVSDLLKFALLRALAADDRKLGIGWYYVPENDGRPDGRHLEWRDEPAWRSVDAHLHRGLSELSDRSIASLESADIWPGRPEFHREPMPRRRDRESWALRQRTALSSSDLVFLDPDNGLGEPTSKHATLDEVCNLRRPGRSIVFITFPGRQMPHEQLLASLHEQLARKANVKALTLRTSVAVPSVRRPGAVVPRQRWFTIVDPDLELTARASRFAQTLAHVPRVRVQLYPGK